LKALKKEADERLLVEAAQKDPARFAQLYELNFERVYAYIVRRVQDRAETEDLTAEVFHQALANIQRFEWRGSIKEVAKEMCRTEGAVKQLQFRALSTLRARTEGADA